MASAVSLARSRGLDAAQGIASIRKLCNASGLSPRFITTVVPRAQLALVLFLALWSGFLSVVCGTVIP